MKQLRVNFTKRFDSDSIDFIFIINDGGKRLVAKPVGLDFVQRPPFVFLEPTISIDSCGIDYSDFINSMREHMIMNGFMGQDAEVIKRIENHLEDMRKIVFDGLKQEGRE